MDLATLTNEQLIDAIASHARCDEPWWDEKAELLKRLNSDDDPFVMPVSVSDAIRVHFGGGSRTFNAISKRVRFCYKVWEGKYGPWTPEQAEYAESLILWAINRAGTAESPGHARPRVYISLDLVIHHENTAAGFKAREGETVDITKHLESLGVS